ncbi:MAG: CAP domain-containing protein [Burkholderiales bacterium]|nr:CAP domain-containing protein [Burkholderiales bacterium]
MLRLPVFARPIAALALCGALVAVAATPAVDCAVPLLHPDMLRGVNAVRAAGRTCGSRQMPPAPPLAWSRPLEAAATAHSHDMAARNYFDHVSPEGARAAQRAAAHGYNWHAVGENIAGGDTTAQGVLGGWLASAGHCENIMNPAFADVAVACASQPGSQWGTYWTMVLGKKR